MHGAVVSTGVVGLGFPSLEASLGVSGDNSGRWVSGGESGRWGGW